jgi:hypothetical protein
MTGVFITAIIAQTGFILAGFYRLSDKVERLEAKVDNRFETLNGKVDHQTENFNNQVTTLLTTIHGVDVRLVKLETKPK